MAVDDAFIEAMVHDAGFRLVYVPEAVVYSKGPENVMDFIRQRRRIATGHLHLLKTFRYEVSTMALGKIFTLILKRHKVHFRQTLRTIGAIFLELTGRVCVYYDYYLGKKTIASKILHARQKISTDRQHDSD